MPEFVMATSLVSMVYSGKLKKLKENRVVHLDGVKFSVAMADDGKTTLCVDEFVIAMDGGTAIKLVMDILEQSPGIPIELATDPEFFVRFKEIQKRLTSVRKEPKKKEAKINKKAFMRP